MVSENNHEFTSPEFQGFSVCKDKIVIFIRKQKDAVMPPAGEHS